MKDFVDGNAFNNEQGNRARKLFAAVVLAALDTQFSTREFFPFKFPRFCVEGRVQIFPGDGPALAGTRVPGYRGLLVQHA